MAKKGKFQTPRTSSAQQHVNKSAGKKKKKTKKKGAAGVTSVVVLAVLILALVGAYVYGSKLEAGKTIYPNVRVAGVDVGGMNASEAQDAVEQAVEAAYRLSAGVKFRGAYSRSDIGAKALQAEK